MTEEATHVSIFQSHRGRGFFFQAETSTVLLSLTTACLFCSLFRNLLHPRVMFPPLQLDGLGWQESDGRLYVGQ